MGVDAIHEGISSSRGPACPIVLIVASAVEEPHQLNIGHILQPDIHRRVFQLAHFGFVGGIAQFLDNGVKVGIRILEEIFWVASGIEVQRAIEIARL